jgi:hypothetical protein
MAAQTYTWNTTAGGNWGTAGAWAVNTGSNKSPGANQISDVALIQPITGNSKAYTVTLNITPNNSIASLGVSDNLGTLALSQTTKTLTVTGATTLSVGTINISNTSTLTTGTFAESGGTFTESNGALNVTGAGTALSVTAGSFALSGTGAVSVTNGASFTGGTDTISGGTFNAGTVTAGTALTFSGGTITSGAGGVTINAAKTLTESGSAVLDATTGGLKDSGTLIGSGTVKGTISGTGIIEASAGTLDLTGNITASSGLTFDVFGSATSVLQIDGTVGGSNTFTFLGNSGHILENNGIANKFTTTIAGLNVGASATTPTNYIDFKGQSLTISGSNLHSGTSGTINLSDGSVLTLTGVTGNTGGNWFVDAVSDGSSGTDIFVSTVVCFAAGTRVLTATGERMVESLLQGDIVLTLADGELQTRPVKWIGRRRIDLTAHPRPETVAPIRIQRGAFADNTPHTDLLVSPDHAVFVDGKLICARQLVNGTTIVQEHDWTSVDYFHVELESHAILLAEGLPAESYLDTGNRGFFGNADDPLVLHPDLTDESDYPAREAGSCAPFVSEEAEVQPVWQRLAERAAALGQPVPQHETTTDPAPCLIARGRTVKPMYGENGLYIFALPKGATEVRLVSRATAPTDVRPWLEDRRRLGLYVERIVLRSADDVRDIPVDHPNLSQGWWAVESQDAIPRRWTNGSAVLPLPDMAGPTMLEVRAGSAGLSYPLQPMREVRAA